MSLHLTPIRIAIIKSQEAADAGEDVEKQECFYIAGGSVNQLTINGKVWQFSTIQNQILFDPEIPSNGYIPKDYKSFYYRIRINMFYCESTVHNSKDLEPTQMLSTIGWIRKYQLLYYRSLMTIKRDEFMSFAGTLDEAGNHHSQQTNTEQKTKHCIFSLISGS